MRFGLGLALTLVAVAAPSAQTTAQAPPTPTPTPATVQTFGVEASRVLLDVIVRDGKDNPMIDLEAADFEVYEDGVRQRVDLFEVDPVGRADQPGNPRGGRARGGLGRGPLPREVGSQAHRVRLRPAVARRPEPRPAGRPHLPGG